MQNAREKFEDRLRVRACGMIFQQDSILLVKHKNIGENNVLWAPPGGEVIFGESAEEALKREIKEETGLEVIGCNFLSINEFIAPPLHAIELFFSIDDYNGLLKTGSDPEMGSDQIIEEVRFVTFYELSIMDESKKHNILHGSPSKKQLQSMSRYQMFHDYDRKA